MSKKYNPNQVPLYFKLGKKHVIHTISRISWQHYEAKCGTGLPVLFSKEGSGYRNGKLFSNKPINEQFCTRCAA